jgi:hypothetical protein
LGRAVWEYTGLKRGAEVLLELHDTVVRYHACIGALVEVCGLDLKSSSIIERTFPVFVDLLNIPDAKSV